MNPPTIGAPYDLGGIPPVSTWEITDTRSVVFSTPTCDECICARRRSPGAIAALLEAAARWLVTHPDELPLSIALHADPSASSASVIITVESLTRAPETGSG